MVVLLKSIEELVFIHGPCGTLSPMLPPFVSAFLMPFLAPGRPISQRLLLLLQAELMPHKEICRRKAF